jgi:hypothetical protein
MRRRASLPGPAYAVIPGNSNDPPKDRAAKLAPDGRTAGACRVQRGPLCEVVPGPWRALEQGRGGTPGGWAWLSGAFGRVRLLMLGRDRLPVLDLEGLSDHLLRDLGLTGHVEPPPRR